MTALLGVRWRLWRWLRCGNKDTAPSFFESDDDDSRARNDGPVVGYNWDWQHTIDSADCLNGSSNAKFIVLR